MAKMCDIFLKKSALLACVQCLWVPTIMWNFSVICDFLTYVWFITIMCEIYNHYVGDFNCYVWFKNCYVLIITVHSVLEDSAAGSPWHVIWEWHLWAVLSVWSGLSRETSNNPLCDSCILPSVFCNTLLSLQISQWRNNSAVVNYLNISKDVPLQYQQFWTDMSQHIWPWLQRPHHHEGDPRGRLWTAHRPWGWRSTRQVRSSSIVSNKTFKEKNTTTTCFWVCYYAGLIDCLFSYDYVIIF